MNISPKLDKPLTIILNKRIVIPDIELDEKYSLDTGVMFGSVHYGFIIISDTTKSQKENMYFTQCRIQGLEIKDGFLNIYEEGKYHPWIFKINGTLVKHATFNEFSRRDLDYLGNNFNIYNKNTIKEVNKLRLR